MLPGPGWRDRRPDLAGLNGRPIVSAAQLRARVGLIPVGQTIELDVLRGGSRVKLNARVATASSPARLTNAYAARLPLRSRNSLLTTDSLVEERGFAPSVPAEKNSPHETIVIDLRPLLVGEKK